MVDAGRGEASLDFSRFFVVLARRWRVIVCGILLGALAAGAWYALRPTQATAVTLVNVNVISDEPFTLDRPASDLVDAETEVQLVRSTNVVTDVSNQLGTLTPTEVRNATAAALLSDGTVLRITFSSSSASEAQQAANLVAEAYLDYRSSLAQARVDETVSQLDARRTESSEQIAALRTELAEAANPEVRAGLQAELNSLTSVVGTTATRLSELQGLNTTAGTVLSSADGGSTTVTPSPVMLVASGLLGGALLGIVLAFVLNTLDRRVRDDHDIRLAGGGDVLARLVSTGARLPPSEADDDAMRSLRERLLAVVPSDGQIITVADVSRRSMPSDVGVNLALMCSKIGIEIRLMLLEQPSQFFQEVQEVLQLSPTGEREGLASFESQSYAGVSVYAERDGASGASTGVDQMTTLLESDADRPGLTLVVTPRDASRSLRLAAGRVGHEYVLVVSERDTTIGQISALAADLRSIGVTIHGTVLVPPGRKLHTTAARPGVTRSGRTKAREAGKQAPAT